MTGPPAARGARGTALVAAILLLMLLSATGLGLALTASLEPSISRNFETASGALMAAETGIILAAHDLVLVGDWSSVLQGPWRPPLLALPGTAGPAAVGTSAPTWTALTSVASCGQVLPCSPAAIAAVTLDRPWGSNNPRWRLLGVTRAGNGFDDGVTGPFEVGVWVGDDPSEADGDSLTDGGSAGGVPGEPGPGLGILVLRAEAFGLRGEHGSLRATLFRTGVAPARLRNWVVGS